MVKLSCVFVTGAAENLALADAHLGLAHSWVPSLAHHLSAPANSAASLAAHMFTKGHAHRSVGEQSFSNG